MVVGVKIIQIGEISETKAKQWQEKKMILNILYGQTADIVYKTSLWLEVEVIKISEINTEYRYVHKCPNCGATVINPLNHNCEYCGSYLFDDKLNNEKQNTENNTCNSEIHGGMGNKLCYQYDNHKKTPTIYESITPPLHPNKNDIWLKIDTIEYYGYINDNWVQISKISSIIDLL